MPRTPKEAFRTGAHRDAFEKMAATVTFDTACEYALLELIHRLPDCSGNPNENWAKHSETIGARAVLDILRSLHLPDEEPPSMKLRNLTPPK